VDLELREPPSPAHAGRQGSRPAVVLDRLRRIASVLRQRAELPVRLRPSRDNGRDAPPARCAGEDRRRRPELVGGIDGSHDIRLAA